MNTKFHWHNISVWSIEPTTCLHVEQTKTIFQLSSNMHFISSESLTAYIQLNVIIIEHCQFGQYSAVYFPPTVSNKEPSLFHTTLPNLTTDLQTCST